MKCICKISVLVITMVATIAFHSCEWLPLYTDEKYTGEALNGETGMNCMEFIESRPDIFSNLKEAIDICGIRDYYTQSNVKRTYLLLTNTALSAAEVANATTPEKITALRNVLLFHIVQGFYHAYGTLSYDPAYVITLWKDPNAIMSLTLGQSASSFQNQDTVRAMDQCGSSSAVVAVSSNYFLTNGVAHVFDRKCVYKK